MPKMDRASFSADWEAAFQKLENILCQCEPSQTAAPDEAAYKPMLSEIITSLRDRTKSLRNRVASSEWADDRAKMRWQKLHEIVAGIASSLSFLESKLDPECSRNGQPSADRPSLKWQMSSQDVEDFTRQADALCGRMRSLWSTFRKESEMLAASAPPILFIYKFERLRDKLFPLPERGPWVRIDELRQWLDHCDNHHSGHCQFSARSEQVFVHRPKWLIDVNRHCLVPAQPHHRYMALSYVWGSVTPFRTRKSNIERLQQEGSLPIEYTFTSGEETQSASKGLLNTVQTPSLDHELTTLSRTVRDVIVVTQKLGEQFLWVDSLCIVQDDDEEKHEQLSHMGSIYANAYVTIVATTGNASHGLRGIENLTPPMKRTVKVPTHLRYKWRLDCELREQHRELLASDWNHRAWTFQEQIFSRRLLIFGSKSATWECHCAVWVESLEKLDFQCQNNQEMIAQGFSCAVPAEFKDYARHVARYNYRGLSYPEDALDAFSGILGVLDTVFDGGFICGLPAMFFDAALLWYNGHPMKRRRARREAGSRIMPPTWAWSAWQGEISFLDQGREFRTLRPLVEWKYRRTGEGHWESIPPFGHNAHSDKDRSSTAEISTVVPFTKSLMKERNDVKTGSSLVLREIIDHLLFARPQRAFFRSMQLYSDVQILLEGEPGDCVGMITSCEQPFRSANRQDLLCEVVAISEIIVNGDEALNVLWIEWKNSIAYRKGVGRILKTAWVAQKPEIIDFILG